MTIRNQAFTFKLADLEMAALENLQIFSGGRDRASVLRALIWLHARMANILTDGDIQQLSKSEPRGRKPSKQRSEIYE